MSSYCFGDKEGLYEEMIRETLNPLLDVLVLEELVGLQSFGNILVLRGAHG